MTTKTISQSERGHVKNLQNFDDLIQCCIRFAAQYNPAATNLTLTQLQTKNTNCIDAHENTIKQHAIYTHKVNERQYEFEKLSKRITRVIQALTAITDDQKFIKDIRTFSNKIHGNPAKIKTIDDQQGQEVTKTISNSQRSYDKKLEHFLNIIHLLQNETRYAPNEYELSVDGLQDYYEQLKDADKQLQLAFTNYKKALTDRDHQFYHPQTGLVNTAKLIKNYIKSVFGAKSLEYDEVSNIEFKTIKR